MARFNFEIWLSCTLFLTAFTAFALSDQQSEEKSYCTADSCDEVAKDKTSGGSESEKESDIHLAYDCVSPEHVPEEDVPVIFLHSLTDSRKTWDGIYQNIPPLTHRKACRYDARNHGDSDWKSPFKVEVLAEDLGHFMDKMKIERAVLVGHSMGAMTAIQFALTNPTRVDRLFLEDISPVSMTKEGMDLVTAWLNLLQSSLSAIPENADEETAKNTVVAYLREILQKSLPLSFTHDPPLHMRDGVWRWKANFDLLMKLPENVDEFLAKPTGQYDGKTVFMYGKISQFKVWEDEEEIKKFFPNAVFIGVDGADHCIHTCHSEFVNELFKFLWE